MVWGGMVGVCGRASMGEYKYLEKCMRKKNRWSMWKV